MQIQEQKGGLVDMTWENVLKMRNTEPVAWNNLNYFKIADAIPRIMQQSKSSPQFQQNMLQTFNQLRDEMNRASKAEGFNSDGAKRQYIDARDKLNQYLTETISPLNPSLAKVVEKLRSAGHMNVGRPIAQREYIEREGDNMTWDYYNIEKEEEVLPKEV